MLNYMQINTCVIFWDHRVNLFIGRSCSVIYAIRSMRGPALIRGSCAPTYKINAWRCIVKKNWNIKMKKILEMLVSVWLLFIFAIQRWKKREPLFTMRYSKFIYLIEMFVFFRIFGKSTVMRLIIWQLWPIILTVYQRINNIAVSNLFLSNSAPDYEYEKYFQQGPLNSPQFQAKRGIYRQNFGHF